MPTDEIIARLMRSSIELDESAAYWRPLRLQQTAREMSEAAGIMREAAARLCEYRAPEGEAHELEMS